MVKKFEIHVFILIGLLFIIILLNSSNRENLTTDLMNKNVCCCRYPNSYGLGCNAVNNENDCKSYCQLQGGEFCGFANKNSCDEPGYGSCRDYCSQIS